MMNDVLSHGLNAIKTLKFANSSVGLSTIVVIRQLELPKKVG